MIHVFSRFPTKDTDTLRRQTLAQSTWVGQRWKELPVDDAILNRRFPENGKLIPYVKDLFDMACANASDDEAIVYSNADIGMVPQASVNIAFALQANNAGYAFRVDFPRLSVVPSVANVEKGQEYCGTDVYFFRAAWWKACRHAFPDMLIAREAWDPCLRVLMEETNENQPLGLRRICWHERHSGPGHWETTANRYTLPGQRYNLALAKMFMKQHGLNPETFGIR